MTKIIKIGANASAILLGLLGVIFTILAVFPPYSYSGSAIVIAYIQIGICALIAIGAGIIALATNFKRNVKVLVGIIAMVIIVGIAWGMANDYVPSLDTDIGQKWDKNGINAFWSKFSGMGAYLSIIFPVAAVLAIVVFEIRNIFK